MQHIILKMFIWYLKVRIKTTFLSHHLQSFLLEKILDGEEGTLHKLICLIRDLNSYDILNILARFFNIFLTNPGQNPFNSLLNLFFINKLGIVGALEDLASSIKKKYSANLKPLSWPARKNFEWWFSFLLSIQFSEYLVCFFGLLPFNFVSKLVFSKPKYINV